MVEARLKDKFDGADVQSGGVSAQDRLLDRVIDELIKLSLSDKGALTAAVSEPESSDALNVTKIVFWHRKNGPKNLEDPDVPKKLKAKEVVADLYQRMVERDDRFSELVSEHKFQEYAGVCMAVAYWNVRKYDRKYSIDCSLPEHLLGEGEDVPDNALG